MSPNAPYYQMRASRLSTNPHSSSAAEQSDALQNGGYDLTSMTVMERSTGNQHVPVLSGSTARRPGADYHHNDLEETHNLAELLEAATTAADQDSPAMHSSATVSTVPHPKIQNERKRGSSPQTGASLSIETNIKDNEGPTLKRRRIITSSTDPSLQPGDNDTVMRSPASNNSPSPSRDLLVDARAAGVHSAAALFRRTSTSAARKYTRPPMSKLFMSLNITPENFIALQSLAKTYMLSSAHPERQSCVGNRGKGDTDMVKLRLFNCVRDFLADGVGEQFFGEHVTKPGERENSEAAAALGEKEAGGEKPVWPRDGNKIISLVTPLMRRMVTNERQRLYAIDTRKGGKKTEKESSVEASAQHSPPDTPAHDVEQQPQTLLDPTLQRPAAQRSLSSTPPSAAAVRQLASNAITSPTPVPVSPSSPTLFLAPFATDASEPHLTNINIFLTYNSSETKTTKLDEKRISTTRPAHLSFYNYTAFIEQVYAMVSRAELHYPFIKNSDATLSGLSETESLRGLAAAANALQPDKDDQHPRSSVGTDYTIKTIGPTGWQVIDSPQAWYHVLTERAFAMWADGVCNIIVVLGAAQAMARRDGLMSERRDREVRTEDA